MAAGAGVGFCIGATGTGVQIEEDSNTVGMTPVDEVDHSGPCIHIDVGRQHCKRGMLSEGRAKSEVSDWKTNSCAVRDSGKVMQVGLGQSVGPVSLPFLASCVEADIIDGANVYPS